MLGLLKEQQCQKREYAAASIDLFVCYSYCCSAAESCLCTQLVPDYGKNTAWAWSNCCPVTVAHKMQFALHFWNIFVRWNSNTLLLVLLCYNSQIWLLSVCSVSLLSLNAVMWADMRSTTCPLCWMDEFWYWYPQQQAERSRQSMVSKPFGTMDCFG